MRNYTFQSSNAFVETFEMPPKLSGILDGLTFGVKDNIDLAGYKTSYGSKPWAASHPPAVSHAVCVEQLLNAGAHCVGKTISDELTHSLDGESYFYGTPINPKAPDRIPGGSSSGSASAVACGLVDFAVGTDSAGSTRVPASHCGILGMRPTIHRISESGVLPFAPSSSTVGVFANTLTVLDKAMRVLLSTAGREQQQEVGTIYLLEDALLLADREIRDALQVSLLKIHQRKNINVVSVNLCTIFDDKEMTLPFWRENIFSVIQRTEIWNSVGAWIESEHPEMSSSITNGMAHHKQFDRSALNQALQLKERVFSKIFHFMNSGDLFCFPTVPMVAPLKGELINEDKRWDYYMRTMSVTSFSGVACLPEITLPVASVKNVPLGLSLVAGHRQDEFLLNAAKILFPELC